MAKLEDTDPYFIRCIKPNATQSARLFEQDLVLSQLRYTGMVETIRIRALGYSLRMQFDDFYSRCVLRCAAPQRLGCAASAPIDRFRRRRRRIVLVRFVRRWCRAATFRAKCLMAPTFLSAISAGGFSTN